VSYAVNAESDGERILKIGQHLPKLWPRIKVGVFFWTQCSKIKCICSNLCKGV